MSNTFCLDNSVAKEFWVDSEGFGFVTIRGTARICGVTHKAIQKLLDRIKSESSDSLPILFKPFAGQSFRGDNQNTSKIAQTGSSGGLQDDNQDKNKDGDQNASKMPETCSGGRLQGGNQNSKIAKVRGGIQPAAIYLPDDLVSSILFYYASQGKAVAQQTVMVMGAIGIRTVIQKSLGWRSVEKRTLTNEEIIELCVLPVPSTWQRRFPQEYYDELSRLTGLKQNGHTRPSQWGALTKELIYDYLPTGIYDAVKKCQQETGNCEKIHQFLSEEGLKLLEKQQVSVLTHMYGASSLKDLKQRIEQSATRQYQLLLF